MAKAQMERAHPTRVVRFALDADGKWHYAIPTRNRGISGFWGENDAIPPPRSSYSERPRCHPFSKQYDGLHEDEFKFGMMLPDDPRICGRCRKTAVLV